MRFDGRRFERLTMIDSKKIWVMHIARMKKKRFTSYDQRGGSELEVRGWKIETRTRMG